MILVPGIVYVLTYPLSGRLRPSLRMAYRTIGGLVVFVGGGFAFYLAWYTGEQGGIAAFFLQKAVILTYTTFSFAVVVVNWFLRARRSGTSQN